MPTILFVMGWRFFFYANEGAAQSPAPAAGRASSSASSMTVRAK